MIAFTRELVAIPTENPPGNHYRACAVAIARKLEQIGLEPAIIETPGTGYCVLAFHGEGERVLHFHGHYDVVPRSVDGQFEPAIKGGKLFGRGSSDMKSGLAAMIFAVKAIRQAGVKHWTRSGWSPPRMKETWRAAPRIWPKPGCWARQRRHGDGGSYIGRVV